MFLFVLRRPFVRETCCPRGAPGIRQRHHSGSEGDSGASSFVVLVLVVVVVVVVVLSDDCQVEIGRDRLSVVGSVGGVGHKERKRDAWSPRDERRYLEASERSTLIFPPGLLSKRRSSAAN